MNVHTQECACWRGRSLTLTLCPESVKCPSWNELCSCSRGGWLPNPSFQSLLKVKGISITEALTGEGGTFQQADVLSAPHLCVQFAEAACGGATVMLNGAIEAPFDPKRSVPRPLNLLRSWLEMAFSHMGSLHFSVFGSAEVPNLSPAKVRKLTVVLAMPINPK